MVRVISRDGIVRQASGEQCLCGGTNCAGVVTGQTQSMEGLEGIVSGFIKGRRETAVFALIVPKPEGASKMVAETARALCGRTSGVNVQLVLCACQPCGCGFERLLAGASQSLCGFLNNTKPSPLACGKALPKDADSLAGLIEKHCAAYVGMREPKMG